MYNNTQTRPLGGLGSACSRRTEKLGSLVNQVLIGFAAVCRYLSFLEVALGLNFYPEEETLLAVLV
ncbi:Protein kinase domain-containing protein [Psidium guajava]|nr:Protein kinase domain-containing protein [Psidium guajava]